MVSDSETSDQLDTNNVFWNSPGSQTEYCYEPLGADDLAAIRIFHLEPAEGEDAPIIGRLERGSYASSDYTAVSYVWGDPTPKHQITINGQIFYVATNASWVLKWLRKSTESLALWLDAVCINQADTEERNSQVQSMAGVYVNALEVVACLGYKTPDFDLGFSFLKWLTRVSIDNAEDQIVHPSNSTALEAVLSLLDKPYWSRLWILQEIAVNREVGLRFENDTRSELAVVDLVRFAQLCNNINRNGRTTTLTESILWQLSRVSDRVSPIATTASLFPLTVDELQPLLYTHVWGGPIATDPLDYVYGLFGLFADAPFPVNYALQPKQLYLKVLQVVQERTGHLDFLSHAWTNYPEKGRSGFDNKFQLPRWAIDFSYRTSGLVPYPLAEQSRNSRIVVRTSYHASGDRIQKIEFAPSYGDYFKASGIVAATLKQVGSTHDHSTSDLIWPQDWNALGRPTASSAPLRSQQARANQPDLEVWSAEESSGCFEEADIWWRTLCCDSAFSRKRTNESEKYRELIPPRHVEAVEELCAMLTRDLSIPMHDGRRMFKTTDGRLGLAPAYARTGDVVCVLFGGEVPYVLRKMGDLDYEFVGECYLHDAMDGQELLKGHPEQRFTIYG